MKLNQLLIFSAIVFFVYGIGFLLVPDTWVSIHGSTVDVPGKHFVQLFGAAFIGLGLISWVLRKADDSEIRRSLVRSFFICWLLLFVVRLTGQLSGVWNTFAWLPVALGLLLVAGFGYFTFKRPRAG